MANIIGLKKNCFKTIQNYVYRESEYNIQTVKSSSYRSNGI